MSDAQLKLDHIQHFCTETMKDHSEDTRIVMKYELFDKLPGKQYEELTKRFNTPREQSMDLYEHAKFLTENPMKWSLYPRPLNSRPVSTLTNIKCGAVAAYSPTRGFQVATRKGQLFIRYNPDAVDPISQAWEDGYAKGREEVMEEVDAVVWSFRETLMKIRGHPSNGKGRRRRRFKNE